VPVSGDCVTEPYSEASLLVLSGLHSVAA